MSLSFKSQLAPKGLQFKPSEIIIGNKYCAAMTIISYPKAISEGYLANITQIAGIKVCIKHIPIDFSVLSKMLNKEIADLKSKYQDEKDRTMQERIRQDFESIESFISMLTATQARIFDFQMHLLISADSHEELENKKLQVKNYLEAMGMKGVILSFEQRKILESMIPIFDRNDIEDRIGTPIPSVTMAAMYPFVFDSIKDPGLSCLLGVDYSGGVILFNQFLYQTKKEFNRNNANMIILGTSGSGKSTAAKVLLRSNIRNGHKIIAIDPEGELEEMAKLYGGNFIDLGRGGDFGMINPLEVVLDADEDEMQEGMGYAILTRTIQTVKAFMKYYSPDIEEDVLTLFSEVLMETYARFKINYNTDFSKYSVYDILAVYYELRYYFTGKTTIETDADFIVFNIREIMNADSNIRNALFFNILKYAWGLTLDKDINTILMVDEAHMLLADQNSLGAEFLARIQRRSRKYNTGTIIITQQPTDLAAPSVIVHGKAIFDNAAYYLIMGLKKQAVDDLSKLIDLNDQEKDSIKRYSQGQALFVCGNRRMRINVIATQQELESFGSGGGL